jgi:hypothetical protein
VKHPSQDFSDCNDVFLLKVAYFCYFGLAVLAQIPCIADLKGITQRKAFVFSRQTLEQYGEDQLFQSLLQILGSNGINEQQARESLSELEEAYHYALAVFRTPFRADFELCEAARPTAIGGSRSLIDRGFYREAMYRIFIERAWFQNAIENDAPRFAVISERTFFEMPAKANGIGFRFSINKVLRPSQPIAILQRL